MGVEKEKPHCGYYALPIFAGLIVAAIAVGMLVSVFLSQVAGIAILFFGAYLFVTYAISMYLAKQSQAAGIPETLRIRGDERVLDVGCGLRKLTVGLAKHLTTGKVVGVDIWSKTEIPGNSPERAYQNAELEGVSGKVEFRTADVLRLPFPNDSFDLVTSSSVMNNLHSEPEKLRALAEAFRVLRLGGKFLMREPLRNLRGFFLFSPFAFPELLPRDKWVQSLDRKGFVGLRYSYSDDTGDFVLEKPR